MPRKDIEPIQVHVPIGTRQRIRDYAESKGMDVSVYIRTLIENDMNIGKRKSERINLAVLPGAPRNKKAPSEDEA